MHKHPCGPEHSISLKHHWQTEPDPGCMLHHCETKLGHILVILDYYCKTKHYSASQKDLHENLKYLKHDVNILTYMQFYIFG